MPSYLSTFSMPNPVKITGRSSSITNSFINAIIPTVPPSEEDVREALGMLGMDPSSITCAYCGDTHTEWDHLRPLVKDQKPTGYISEIHNLVPACGKCNQSKGNKPWRDWILSSARLSPKTRGVADLEHRVNLLEAYENWRPPTKYDFESLVGAEKWGQHWKNWERVLGTMKEAQTLADEINRTIREAAV